jgi:predicted nucleic acid-binding protein
VVQAFVIDPSVLIQGFIQDTQTAHVQTLLRALIEPDSLILHTPEFCFLECTNILWKQARFHNVSIENVSRSLVRLQQTPVTVHPASSLLARALTIGIENELAIYDC